MSNELNYDDKILSPWMVWYGKFGLVFGQKRILVKKGFSTQKSFGAIKLWSKKDVFWKNDESKIF